MTTSNNGRWYWIEYGNKKLFSNEQSALISGHFASLKSDTSTPTYFPLPNSNMSVNLDSMEVVISGKPYKMFFMFDSPSLQYRITIAGDKDGIPPAEQGFFSDPRYKGCAGFTWMWWGNDINNHGGDPFHKFANDEISTKSPQWRPYSKEESEIIENGYLEFLALGGNLEHTKDINERFGASYCRLFNDKKVMIQYRRGNENLCRPIARATYIWLWKSSDNDSPEEEWTPYLLEDAIRLEGALIKGEYEVNVDTPHNGAKIVNLVEMIQYDKDSQLKRREVRRVGTALVEAFKRSIFLKPNYIPESWDKEKDVKVSKIEKGKNDYKSVSKILADSASSRNYTAFPPAFLCLFLFSI